jgi:hypothetical protein
MAADEQYEFKAETKKKLVILVIVGIIVFAIGVFSAMSGGHHAEAAQEAPAKSEMSSNEAVIDKTAPAETAISEKAAVEGHDEHAADEHHGSKTWVKRIFTSIWVNNLFFTGLGIIGLFFVAIQYAAQAGWSAGIKRIPLAMGAWIPWAGIIMLISWFVVKHDIFHWTHASLYLPEEQGGDKIIQEKSPLWYWPGPMGGFPIFYIFRMILFFGLWYMFYTRIRSEMMAEDIEGGVTHWYKSRKLSAIFLIIFAVSSSVAAWDWVMSIDPHWFSTMFGWYIFASWWVTGLAVITLIVVNLKGAGYLKIVRADHLHDLGKFCFAFSIFWTYIWFSQFLLIYYANIPEESVYFIERLQNAPYNKIFYMNLFLNFVFPFLLFMTRDAKRQMSMLKVVCPIIIVGHWFDFYQMITPGVMMGEGTFGFLEIGVTLIFIGAFLFVTLTSLSSISLVPKHDPMMEESLHHHI